MFEKWRKPRRNQQSQVKKVFSYIIFGVICIIFVFLTPMTTQIFGGGVVAYVGSEPIRSLEFRMVEDNLKNQNKERLNSANSQDVEKLQKQIRERALQELINVSLISQGALRSGFTISDKELQEEIKSYPAFQSNNRFVYSRYLSFLKSQRMQASQFENRIRRFKSAERWKSLFLKSITPNHLEKMKNKQKQLYKTQFRYAEVSLSLESIDYLENLVTSKNKQKVQSFLKQNQVEWQTTQEVSPISPRAIPSIGYEDFMEDILNHLPSQGLVPQLLKRGSKAYIVEIMSFRVQAKEDENLKQISQLLQYEKSYRLFDSWLQAKKDQFPIKISLEI